MVLASENRRIEKIALMSQGIVLSSVNLPIAVTYTDSRRLIRTGLIFLGSIHLHD
jgi:hypothetical protein